MSAENFLKELNPHSKVFDLSVDYKYTEEQLVLFAELYHKNIAEKQERNQIIRAVNYSIMNLDKLREQAIKENKTIGEIYVLQFEKIKYD